MRISVARVALAFRADRHVNGHHQRPEPGVGAAADHVCGNFAVARRIDLIPGLIAGDARGILDGVVAGAGHDVGHIGLGRRGGQHQVGSHAEQSGGAGGCETERAGPGAAEQCRRLVDPGHVDEIARQQAVALKRRFVARQRGLRLDTAFDEVERHFRRPPLGHPIQIVDVDRFFHTHERLPVLNLDCGDLMRRR